MKTSLINILVSILLLITIPPSNASDSLIFQCYTTKNKKIEISETIVGNYMTSIDMAGLSLTMIKLEDDQWLKNLNEDVKTISWG